VSEEVLEPAADAARVEELAMYAMAYFEGKGLEAHADTFRKRLPGGAVKYYLLKVSLETGFNELEGLRVYPVVTHEDVGWVKEKASLLGYELTGFAVELIDCHELGLRLYLREAKA
jgi:hypothetical protein